MVCIKDADQISQGSRVFPPDTELTLAQQQFAFVSSAAGCRVDRARHHFSEAQAADGCLYCQYIGNVSTVSLLHSQQKSSKGHLLTVVDKTTFPSGKTCYKFRNNADSKTHAKRLYIYLHGQMHAENMEKMQRPKNMNLQN